MAGQSTALRETAPAGVATAVSCCVSCLGGPKSRVMQEPPGKLARLRVECCCACSTPLHPLTGGPSLLPVSRTRLPIGSPYGSLSLAGERRAYHVPHEYHWMSEALPVRRWRDICGRRYGSVSA